MTPAEHIYRALLWLYPAKHRRVYSQPMLQHARDMCRAARQRGRRHVATLCLHLLFDGVVNAGIEHMEAIMTTNGTFKPVPWLGVLLTAIPGLLYALSRRHAELLAPILEILWIVYIVVLVFTVPIEWWRRRRFPVWALLPAGALMWFLTYTAGREVSEQMKMLGLFGSPATGMVLLNSVLAVAIFLAVLRAQRVPSSVWVLIGVIVLGRFLVTAMYGLARFGGARQLPSILQFFSQSLAGPAEGLMLVAVGLLVARQHGVLALLVVVGGYSYLLTDSDYLFGFPLREWTGLSLYLVTMTILFLVVTPVALLRAKTGLGRAIAVCVPAAAFHVARLTIPFLVVGQSLTARPGDVMISVDALLSLWLAWVLYSHGSHESRDVRSVNLEVTPFPG